MKPPVIEGQKTRHVTHGRKTGHPAAACRRVQRALILAAFGFLALLILPLVGGAEADILNKNDTKYAKAAFKAMKANRWRGAMGHMGRIQDPTTRRIIQWLALTRPGASTSFKDISTFLETAPGWPQESTLRRRAEEAMTAKTPDAAVFAWNKKYGMASTDGRARLIAALIAAKRTAEAKKMVRDVWINGNFTKSREKAFYRRYRKHLTAEDHIARLERLLWDERYWPARRMLWKVNKNYRALAEARLMLMRREGNVDTAIARVPEELKNDPGLTFERLRWRRRKGKDTAFDILKANKNLNAGRPEKWWVERSYLARRALRKGDITEAYRIASQHGLSAGAKFAEAEWLSGWIALRFLNDAESAFRHFRNMKEKVSYPISVARANYWAGRAAGTLGNGDIALGYYETAAEYTNTYYGQLAAEKLDRNRGVVFPPKLSPSANEQAIFNANELVRAARILAELDQSDQLRPFVHSLLKRTDTPIWQSMTATLALKLGRPDLAVSVAKIAERNGTSLAGAGYPQLTPPKRHKNAAPTKPETPLILAMIRQESAFYVSARSRANALGLMQILPSTARRVARELKVSYSKSKLTKDPTYNLTLGQSYLAGLLEEFEGSYVLAVAAYNAGPSRSRRWLREFGDLRAADIDPVDWVEQIPIYETRNYVQRVLENLQVYRQQLNNNKKIRVALNLEQDLRR